MADFRATQLGAMRSGAIGVGTMKLDATNDRVAWIGQAEEAATITHVGFVPATVNGTPATYKIGFQGLDADGLPDGTYLGGGSPNSATVTPVGGDVSVWQWVALDNNKTVTKAEVVCIVMEYSSGTIDGSNHIRAGVNVVTTPASAMPYYATETAGAGWVAVAGPTVWGMKSSTTIYGVPISNVLQTVIDSADTPDEIGIAFTVPDGITDKFTVMGGLFNIDTDGHNSNFTFTLYSDATPLQQIVVTDLPLAVEREHGILFDETTLSSLDPGTEYILAVKTDSATDRFRTYALKFQDTDERDSSASFFGVCGMTGGKATRTDSGAWTIDYTQVVQHSAIIKSLTEAAGGSGGAVKQAGRGGGMAG